MAKTEAGVIHDIEKIVEVVLAFNSVNDRTELLNIILTKMMEMTHSDAGTLYIVDGDKLRFRIIHNNSYGIYQSDDIDEASLPPITLDVDNIQNISAYSALRNEIVNIDDVYSNDQFNFSGPKIYDRMTGYRTRAMLVIPICTQVGEDSEVLGVIQMMNPIDPVTQEPITYGNIFSPPILPAFAKIAANTLSNLTYVNELRLLLRSFAAVMTQAIDERSPYNNNHTQYVAHYCEKFATYLSKVFPPGHKYHFDDFHIERIVLAALLHDIGKIITPLSIMDKSTRLGDKFEVIRYRFELKKHQLEIDRLNNVITEQHYRKEKEMVYDAQVFVEYVNSLGFLTEELQESIKNLHKITFRNPDGMTVNVLEPADIEVLSVKAGTLTANERSIMQDHAVITGKLLDKIPSWKYYKGIPDWARSHHEFLDGTGYPQGLQGDEVPLESCIITIMDIFDALIAKDRPYKAAVPLEKSLTILQDMAEEGKLHEELVGLFVESRLWEGVHR